jgi:hypothetical protein
MHLTQKTSLRVELMLTVKCRDEIQSFFKQEYHCVSEAIFHHMHLTVYHCEAPMPQADLGSFEIEIAIPIAETRFMVMAPGGENAKSHLEPSRCKIGIRIKQRGGALYGIQDIRQRFCALETVELLRGRNQSTNKRSAFGAKSFQPHVTMLKPNNGIQRDLKPIGEHFRNTIKELCFDRLVVREVDCIHQSPPPP